MTDPLPFDVALSIYGRQTLLDPARLKVLYDFAAKVSGGQIWECGVYRGGSAAMMASANPPATLRLFDTFTGLPPSSVYDNHHQEGDFADTSLERVKMTLLGKENPIRYHQGLIPETFRGQEKAQIALAHIDLDLYQSTKDALEFIFPRLTEDGVIVLDDYGWKDCAGVIRAVDQFMGKTPKCRFMPGKGIFNAVIMRD